MTNVLHIYSQSAHHDDACIVGNKESLQRLKAAIEQALEDGAGSCSSFVNDGEGFTTIIINAQIDDSVAVPYVFDYAAEQRKDAKWPWDLIDKETYTKLVKNYE